MALPLVVDESLMRPFQYWREGVQSGGSYNNEIYARFRLFPKGDRLKAYEVAFEQAERGMTVCISASSKAYTVWLSLRSLSNTPANNQKKTREELVLAN